eukprot:363969-Chlamydomonas_euryale.AAC.2
MPWHTLVAGAPDPLREIHAVRGKCKHHQRRVGANTTGGSLSPLPAHPVLTVRDTLRIRTYIRRRLRVRMYCASLVEIHAAAVAALSTATFVFNMVNRPATWLLMITVVKWLPQHICMNTRINP